MTAQAARFADERPTLWSTPKGRNSCGRDPKAGPGSCSFWWEGCPGATRRSCYVAWKAGWPAAIARAAGIYQAGAA